MLASLRGWRGPQVLPALYSAFISLGALVSLISVLRSRSEAGNAFLWGYSLERIIFGFCLLVVSILFFSTALKLAQQPDRSRQAWDELYAHPRVNAGLFWASAVVFLSAYLILNLPDYRLGRLAGYVHQLYPAIVWLAVVSIVTIILILLQRRKESFAEILRASKAAALAAILILSLCLIGMGIVVFTGLGVQHPEDYWYASGVPILGLQVLLSILVGGFCIWLENNKDKYLTARFDIWICIGLWVVTAVLWSREPIQPNFFMPDTAKNTMLPYSDSATYDIGSQYALIGQGLFNGAYFDRALYLALLTYLHMLFGQNFEQLLTAQAALFAVFPFVVYLLGKELHSRALGISAAALILLRGLNSLRSATWLDLASPKMILTDFAAGIGIAFFTLMMVKWLKNPRNGRLAVWTGASLGLTIMLRTNVVLLIPVFLLYMWMVVQHARKYLFIGSLLFLIGMLSATTPWDIRNRSNGTPMFYVYYSRIEIILQHRYGLGGSGFVPQDITTGQRQPAAPRTASLLRQRIDMRLGTALCGSGSCKIANHFFRNFVTSILFLPASSRLDDLWNTVKLENPYWQNSWRGEGLGVTQVIFILFNLALLALGFGAAWQRNRITALVPPILFLVYISSNALALTSGGRYIVPVDWIICLYYMLGWLQLLNWFLRYGDFSTQGQFAPLPMTRQPALPFSNQSSGIVMAVLFVFSLGSLIPLSEKPFAARYHNESADDVLTKLDQSGLLDQSTFSHADLARFMAEPRAEMLVGRLLYPRFYLAGQGENDRNYPYVHLDYPRIVFTAIGPFDSVRRYVIIPGDKPSYELNAQDIIVFGCRESLYMDGLIVFVLSDQPHIFTRNPQAPLDCPFPAPEPTR